MMNMARVMTPMSSAYGFNNERKATLAAPSASIGSPLRMFPIATPEEQGGNQTAQAERKVPEAAPAPPVHLPAEFERHRPHDQSE